MDRIIIGAIIIALGLVCAAGILAYYSPQEACERAISERYHEEGVDEDKFEITIQCKAMG